MKEIYLKFAVFSFLFLACFSVSVAQRSNGLAIDGKISVEEGIVEGAVIQMFQDGRRLDNYGVSADGRYKVELNYSHKFELIFTLKDNFSQKIVVETEVPPSVLRSDPKFPPFPIDINLFTEIPGIDKSFSENTVLKIYYNENVDNFVSELYYNDAQIKKLIDQAILQSQMIGKEADYLSKLTRAELAELRKEYDKLLEEAGIEYSNEQFLAALDGYKAAGQIFPKEQYPKDRIAEINDLLGLIMVASEMDKALAERFNTLIKNADLLFTNKKYFDARNSYNRALSINQMYVHAQQRVNQINEILKKQQIEQQYADVIIRGINANNEMLYDEALQIFNEALQLKPDDEFAKTKIVEINEKLNELAKNLENQKSYDQSIFQAELNFEKQFYDRSLASYENALVYRPGDPKATQKINEIKKLMSTLSNKSLYDKLIKSADKAYNKKLYAEALVDYEKAHILIPTELHSSQRIDEINQLLNSEAHFLESIRLADLEFVEQNFQESKSLYNKALEIHTDYKHALDRIKEIDLIFTQQGTDKQYNTLTAQADQLFLEKDYEHAKNKYNDALGIKSREQYPKDKIFEINSILQGITKTNQEYLQAIKRADDLYQREDYNEARKVYADAGQIKPSEFYPPEMIEKIDIIIQDKARIIAEQQANEQARLEAIGNERDRNYQRTVDEADSLIDENELVAAVGKFRSALDIKPQEQYPIMRIEEIRGMISRQQEAQKAYEEAVSLGDREFRREGFDEAKIAFNEAKQAKSDETYPDEMITKIDSIVEARARLAAEAAEAEQARLAAIEAEKERQYNEAITKADNFFNQTEYENARNDYRSALTIKPDETYPQERIDEIGTLLSQLSAAQKAYEDAVSLGNREFSREGFDEAKIAFNEAKQAKSDETYPDEMIAQIDSIVEARARLAVEAAEAEMEMLAAIEAEKDRQYNEAITKADNFFNQTEYENARNDYRSALTIKPDETYPQERIDEIGTLLAQLSAAQKAYKDAVALGDREFRREGFDEAKIAFNEAKQAKSDETYPDEMITKIDSIVEARARLAVEAAEAELEMLAAIKAEKDRQYNKAITKADNFFNQTEYENARNDYRSALTIKPDETYPQERIDEIGTLLAQLSAAQKAYEDAVALGDREFRREGFDEAKIAFNEAKQAKSDETYPVEMIAIIDSIVVNRTRLAIETKATEQARLAALQAEKDKNYADAISKGDNLFNLSEYENASVEYRVALNVKPEETYSQQRIDEIDKIISERELAQKELELLNINYESAIQQADKFFNDKSFALAKTNYEKASGLKPEEEYPKQKIEEVDSIFHQQELDENYRSIILAADGFFRTESYSKAKEEYENALSVKSEEQYPKNQISKIDNIFLKEQERILAEQNATADLERRKTQLEQSNLEIREQEINSEASLIGLYNEYIKTADTLFEVKQYNVSRAWYFKAWDVKPEETYPPQRIDEINRLISGLLLSQRDRDYQGFINLGDSTFRDNQLAVARGWYNRALSEKAVEIYPKNQLTEIQKKIAERLAGQSGEQFNSHVEKAARAFEASNYNVARFWYKKALELKPNDEGVKTRLIEIQTALK